MQIFVRIMQGKTLTLNVQDSTSIAQIKKMIQEKEGSDPSTQRLIYAGKQLQTDKTVHDYCIYKQTTLHLVYRLPAGSFLSIDE